MATVLIKNGRIVTAVDDYQADILLEDGRIRMIGQGLVVGDNVETHDASGLLVLPGGVDVHTHLDWDFGVARTVDTFGTGTQAATFGGTTTVIDFCNQTRGQSPLVGLEDWHGRAASACVDVGAHMIMLDVNAQSLADMQTLIRREGVTSFKLFMAYPGVLMLDDGALFKAMRLAGQAWRHDLRACRKWPGDPGAGRGGRGRGPGGAKYHSLTRPTLMEGEATHRAIKIAELAETPLYIVHLSAHEALTAVAEARDAGQPVHAETCPHYLFLTNDAYERPDFDGAKYVMTPPLRDRHHQQALWRGLRTNALQVVSTDHCPFCFNEQPFGMKFSKQQGKNDFSKIPNGAPGIETRLPLVYDGGVRQRGLSLNRFVALTATNPAKIFGLFPQERHACRRLRWRCSAVRSQCHLDHPRRRAAQPC